MRSRKQRPPLVPLGATSFNCGTGRWLSVEPAFAIRLGICGSSGRVRWWVVGGSGSRRGLTTGQWLAKVVHSGPLLAGFPHEAQTEQATLHSPRGREWCPARPVRLGPITFAPSLFRGHSSPLKGYESRGDPPNGKIGRHQNRPGGLDTHHRDTQCPNEIELPRRVDLWCILDYCERGGGQVKEPNRELDSSWRASLRRRGGDQEEGCENYERSGVSVRKDEHRRLI